MHQGKRVCMSGMPPPHLLLHMAIPYVWYAPLPMSSMHPSLCSGCTLPTCCCSTCPFPTFGMHPSLCLVCTLPNVRYAPFPMFGMHPSLCSVCTLPYVRYAPFPLAAAPHIHSLCSVCTIPYVQYAPFPRPLPSICTIP